MSEFPRKCECGGRMKYTRELGRVFSCCLACTPVVEIRLPGKAVAVASVSPAEGRTSTPEA